MLDRLALLVLVSCLAMGCSAEVASSSDGLDELHRVSDVVTVVPADGGIDRTLVMPEPRTPASVPPAAITHDCTDPCPGPCAEGHACCAPLQRCVRLDCPSCCPDPEFGFDAIRTAFADR